MRRYTCYLVGLKGTTTHFWGDKVHTRKQTPDGEDSHAKWMVCYPEHDNDLYEYKLFLDDNYYWIREIDPWLFEEAGAFGYFELVSWYKFVKESIWWEQAKKHMRDTWEVKPDIPHALDYSFLDEIEASKRGPRYLGPQEGPMEDWIPLAKSACA